MNKVQLKSFAHGSLISIVGLGSLGIINYFIRRTLWINLPERDFGLFYSAFALIMLSSIFLDLGLGQSVVILISKSFAEKNIHDARKVFTITFAIKAIMSILLFIILELLSPLLSRYYFDYPECIATIMLLFFLIPANALISAYQAVLIARKAFTFQNIIINLSTAIVLIGVFIFSRQYGIIATVLCYIVARIVSIIFLHRKVRSYSIRLIPLREISLASFRKVFSLSSWIAVSSAGVLVMYYMDTVCLTWLKNLESVAMYNIALAIMQIAQSFFVFPAIFTPIVAEMCQKKDYRGIRKSCLITSAGMLITLPVFIICGIYFGESIIKFLFETKSSGAAPAVTILWAGMVFFSIASFNINAMNAGGQQKTAAVIVISCVLINFILNIVLISNSDFVGAALATAITYLIMALCSVIYTTINLNRKINTTDSSQDIPVVK